MTKFKKSTQALLLQANGYTITQIASKLRVKESSVERYLRRACMEERKEREEGKESPKKKELKHAPDILILDIETAQMRVDVWGLFKQRISHDQIVADWFILSWAAKWLYAPDVWGDCIIPNEALNRDDSRIVKSLWHVINKADIIIGHNVARFDMRKINARFLEHGLLPPSPYRTIDTLTESKKIFALPSYKLDYLTKHFKLNTKIHTDRKLWQDCEKGNPEALDKMFTYNKHDILASEDLYDLIKGWIKHPNLNLYGDITENLCGRCGADDLEYQGQYITPAGRYKAIRCKGCGGYARDRISDLTKEDRVKLKIIV